LAGWLFGWFSSALSEPQRTLAPRGALLNCLQIGLSIGRQP
jgi:hypothetical protein